MGKHAELDWFSSSSGKDGHDVTPSAVLLHYLTHNLMWLLEADIDRVVLIDESKYDYAYIEERTGNLRDFGVSAMRLASIQQQDDFYSRLGFRYAIYKTEGHYRFEKGSTISTANLFDKLRDKQLSEKAF